MVYPWSILFSHVTHADWSQGKHYAWPALLLCCTVCLSPSPHLVKRGTVQQEKSVKSTFFQTGNTLPAFG